MNLNLSFLEILIQAGQKGDPGVNGSDGFPGEPGNRVNLKIYKNEFLIFINLSFNF